MRICALDGCEVSIEDRSARTKYCSRLHADEASKRAREEQPAVWDPAAFWAGYHAPRSSGGQRA